MRITTPLFQYITMAEAAIELQRAYVPEAGDRYVCSCASCKTTGKVHLVSDYDIDYINGRQGGGLASLYRVMVAASGDGYFGAFWDSRHEDGSPGFVWLPSQERLQRLTLAAMAERRGEGTSGIELLDDFHRWAVRARSMEHCGITDLDTLWLGYAMDICFGKEWDGVGWVEQ